MIFKKLKCDQVKQYADKLSSSPSEIESRLFYHLYCSTKVEHVFLISCPVLNEYETFYLM